MFLENNDAKLPYHILIYLNMSFGDASPTFAAE